MSTDTALHIDDDQLSEMFAALASTTRRQMLQRLAAGEATVNELAEPFDLSLPAVSKHVKVLEHAGLITQGRRAQYRPCTINPDALRIVASWTEHYRRIWDDRLDRMDDYLADLSPADTPTDTPTDPSTDSSTGDTTTTSSTDQEHQP